MVFAFYYTINHSTMKNRLLLVLLLSITISTSLKSQKVEVLEKKATEAVEKKDYPKAIQIYSEIIKKSKLPKYFFERGKAYRLTNQNQEALSDFNVVIAQLPKDKFTNQTMYKEYSPYCWRGWTKIDLRDFDGAIYDFNKALDLNDSKSNQVYSFEGHGVCNYRLNNIQLAKDDFNKALSLEPNQYNSLKWRITILIGEKNFNDAIQDIRHAIDLKPNDADNYNQLGVCYYRLKNYDQSKMNYKKAVDISPKNSIFMGNYAMTLARLNKFDEALTNINKAIELDSTVSHSYFQKSRIYALANNKPEALKNLRIAFSKGFKNQDILDLCIDDFSSIYQSAEFISLINSKNLKINIPKVDLANNTQETVVQKIDIKTDQSTSTDDVNIDLPINEITHPYRYALIIGNEDYSSSQRDLNSEVNVQFAENDAKVFKDYAVKVFGIPEENVLFLINAKSIEMDRAITKINLLAKNSNGKAELLLYYAGHGFPDEITKEPYLIPVDVSAKDLKYAIKLSEVYRLLTEYPCQRITVFLDACFSGGARNQGLLSARGVKVKPKENTLTGNIVVFTATSEDQSALPYSDKKHGLFTYFLLKKLKDTSGDVTYQELSDYLGEQVGIKSILINEKEQHSQTLSSSSVQDIWGEWKVK